MSGTQLSVRAVPTAMQGLDSSLGPFVAPHRLALLAGPDAAWQPPRFILVLPAGTDTLPAHEMLTAVMLLQRGETVVLAFEDAQDAERTARRINRAWMAA